MRVGVITAVCFHVILPPALCTARKCECCRSDGWQYGLGYYPARRVVKIRVQDEQSMLS